MKNPVMVFLMIIYFIPELSAQPGYLPGYIVSQSGDTIRGFIKRQTGKLYSQKVVFKESKSAEDVTYAPGDIKSYYILAGELFISEDITYQKVNRDPNLILDESRQNVSNPETVKTTAFLTVRVLGPASLYIYYDDNANPYFFIRKYGDKLYELNQLLKYYRQETNGVVNEGYRIEKNYIGILNFLFNDCPEISKIIEETELVDYELVRLTTAYNKCVSPNDLMEEFSSSKLLESDKSVHLGLNSSGYTFSGAAPSRYYLTKADPLKSQKLNFGFRLELFSPKLSNSFSVSTGLTYFAIYQQYQYHQNIGQNVDDLYDVTLENHYIQLPIILNYNLKLGVIIPYAFIGTHSNIVIKKNNTMVVTRTTALGSTIEEKPAIFNLATGADATRNFEIMGVSTGGGLKYLGKKMPGIFFEIKYDQNWGLSLLTEVSQKAKSLFLTFGIIF
ncbi:MAG TPA: hypothetical protein VI583_01190 [Cyclobacteriaceae bacterium]|nr:hypothetical protein [Cyclobacteriaceae bacterium]